MLQKLTIQNVALIDRAEINFTDGLNVLSGETGAGKSVIIESLNFVLGAKADKTLIRSGESECFVKAEFYVADNDSVNLVLDELDVEKDENIIITRKFNVDGKSIVKVNGNTVTLSMLKKLTALLVDVHGQSEHFHLLKNANQLNLIDKFGGNEILKIKDKLSENYTKYKNIIKEIQMLGGDENQRLLRLDILDYQIHEIEQCDLKENEEEDLIDIKRKLQHQEKISNALNSVKNAISDEGGVNDIIGNVTRVLSGITDLGQDFSELYERINSVFSELDDISDNASNLLDSMDISEFNPDQIESRLEIIKSIKKKYGKSYNEINSFLQQAIEEKEKLENFNENADKLLQQKTQLEDIIYKDYCTLHELRKKSARNFSDNVLNELQELGMSKAKFEIEFESVPQKEVCNFSSANGFDNIEFCFSANLGEPLKPLSSVISGGEMSRFMLSIKAQTAKYNDISTFIFDEIDTGISGLVAKVVAEKFAKIHEVCKLLQSPIYHKYQQWQTIIYLLAKLKPTKKL
ncbi:MAG: DNA repair protein RecN [Clostridia bacterium]|nr:DNA repair protein RecN [Clostridia bacterium]